MSDPRPTSARPRWLIPLVIIVLAVAVSGGIAARGFYRVDADPTIDMPSTETTRPGSTTVRMTPDAARHPEADNVQRLVQNHFDAINGGDYAGWSGTVTDDKVNSMPEAVWRQDFGSTKDTDAVVYRISSAGTGRLRILLRFISRQDPDDAPARFPRPCIQWRVVYGLTADNGVWKVDAGLSAGTRPWDVC